MIVTTISRVFFHWFEYQAMVKFEKENPEYKKIGESSIGTAYEYHTSYVVETEERRDDDHTR